ncbi:hypothetical protein [Thiorhodovibrio winogradskyi]|uniref:hypothetical protein n=1 Tax=Thiorhodovibrio winogradskyi TaxID=77007 RepID=UPI002E27F3D3|nr:hypothetical protein [Thiorhodovibrio winogradskyi]
MIGDMIHGVGEKAARPTGRIVERSDQTRLGLEQGVVWVQQEGDGVGEVELLENDARVVRESGNVVLKILSAPRLGC